MRDEFLRACLWIYVLTSLLLFLSMVYAYRLNAHRPAGDPNKRVYHPLVFILLPIWPLQILFLLLLLILRAVFYGMFLVFFTLALIFVRNSLLLKRLLKAAHFLGDRILRLNTRLIRIFMPVPRMA